MLTEILFYIFSALAILSCLMVVLSSNAVNAILFLIFAYLNVSALFVTIGADFAAMMLMVVYVGAVAVLFLFVVMMLDTDYGSLKKVFHDHSPMILVLTGFFIFLMLLSYKENGILLKQFGDKPLYYAGNVIKDVGMVLYTDYVLYFQLSGFILLLAMIGAIALTLRTRKGVKKQNISQQVLRSSTDAVHNIHIASGSALKD